MKKTLLVIFICFCFMQNSCTAQPADQPAELAQEHAPTISYAPVLAVEAGPTQIDSEQIDELIDDTRDLIKYFRFKGPTKRWANQTLTELNQMRSMFKNPRVKTQGVQLDCIMMIHDLPGGGEELTRLAYQSQLTSVEYLERTNPQIIGMEGIHVEVVTPESMTKATLDSAKFGGYNISKDEAKIMTDDQIRLDAVLIYQQKHPDILVTGTESRAVIILGLDISSLLQNGDGLSAKNEVLLERLFSNITIIRSYLAVVKTLQAAEKRKLTHSSIVIGAGHALQIFDYGKQLGIAMKFYQAVPEEYLEYYPELRFP